MKAWVVLGWEARAQRRDPLTALYAIVFFLLAFGFTSSGAVELVRERGAAPRSSPWALTLAFGGVTAFAQVISTMIAVSAVLRDDATRTIAFVATSGVRPRDWFLGRVGAALLVALLVYAAIPLGALAGALVAGDRAPQLPWRVLRPFVLLTVPTMVAVTALVACTAARTRRAVPALATALLLVACWQGGLTLEADGAGDRLRRAGALLDPFANAPVVRATRGWSESERASRVPPADALLLANRALWLLVAAGAVTLTARRVAFHGPPQREASARQASRGPTRRGRLAARHTSAIDAVRGMTAAWITRDGGWRVIGTLLLVNAALNGIVRGNGGSPAEVLSLVAEGARVFLIVLATVYAGELLWRERELRVAPLVDALPVRTGTLAAGAMLGLARSQLGVVASLMVAGALSIAFGASWAGVGTAVATGPLATLLAWTVFVVWLPFVQLTALSLAIHALVRHKVLAHLLLITGWTIAVVLDGMLQRRGVTAWWLRFARPAGLLTDDGALAWGPLAARAGYWSAVSGALVLLTALRWPRGSGAGRGYFAITSRR